MPCAFEIEFVSDIACPWCAIGLAGLQQALARLQDQVTAQIHLRPFELSPELPRDGGDADQRMREEYGINDVQIARNRAQIRDRAAAMGIDYNIHSGSRIWNTFDAHRLLHWAGLQSHDKALTVKQALFRASFGDEENVSDHAVLTDIAARAGLNAAQARAMLASDQHVFAVRTQEEYAQRLGIRSVPATIVDQSRLISGGQPPETFENILRELATHKKKSA